QYCRQNDNKANIILRIQAANPKFVLATKDLSES
ncbi:unnamed protein product, partial [marine sediment metagenome]